MIAPAVRNAKTMRMSGLVVESCVPGIFLIGQMFQSVGVLVLAAPRSPQLGASPPLALRPLCDAGFSVRFDGARRQVGSGCAAMGV